MIIERLKGFWCDDLELEHRQVIVRNAIEQIERLRAENETLREALIDAAILGDSNGTI